MLIDWQMELDQLVEETGISLDEVCDYIGVSYTKGIGFYTKVPKKRAMFIGIGMAFRQPLEVIDRWIVTYGAKRKLYAKDLSEDFVWIYLIHKNAASDGSVNYYRLYDECQQMVHATYLELWDELYDSSENTTMIDRGLRNMPYQREFKDLIGFVIKHMDSFKTAYARSRRMLEQYVKAITTTRAGDPSAVDGVSLNSLRGWLDDSMINYLSGEPDTIHVSDRRTGKRTAYFKAVPKSRKAHIALCLALGMTRDEVCRYLRTMGYSVLSTEDPEDRRLIRELDQWDREHPWVWQYKQYRISSVPDVEMPPSFGEDNTFRGNLLTPGLERKAVNDMLELRQTLQISYQAAKKEFPYRKDA